MESPNLPVDYLSEEFEQKWEFIKKVEEIDQEESHKGIFLEYINVMKLYESGSLNIVDVKNKVSSIFKNCKVLLDSFHQLLNKNSNSGSIRSHHDVVEIDVSNLERIKEFLKMLSRDCKELRGGFIEIFMRFQEHEDVELFKEEVDSIFRDYPPLKEEFRMILVDYGY